MSQTNVYRPRRVQATRPVSMFGPVPPQLIAPRLQAPVGARYCEEVDGFVPENLAYRIRGIEKAPRKKVMKTQKLADRLFKPKQKIAHEPLVMAMGLTHGKMELISLSHAQLCPNIVYRSVDAGVVHV